MRVAAAGGFLADFEAVPAGLRPAAIELSAAVLRIFAACGLTISFAAFASMVAAGRPINVADAGVFAPLSEAVPLGTREAGAEVCGAIRHSF